MGFFLLTAFSNNNFLGSCCKYVADEPKVSPSAAPQLMSSVDLRHLMTVEFIQKIYIYVYIYAESDMT